MPGCCHRIVKHWPIGEKVSIARLKDDNYLPARSQAKMKLIINNLENTESYSV
jgi:hypothetical protein